MIKTFFVLLFIPFTSLYAYTLSIPDENLSTDINETLELDLKFTGLHRYMKLNDTELGYTFLLAEGGVKGEDLNVDIGVSYQKYFEPSMHINNVSLSFFDDDYKFKIGKFVSSFGVMDYMTSFDDFNPRRLSFYDEENKNISRYATWMMELTAYVNDEVSISFHVQKYDDTLNDYFYAGNYLLFNTVIPFFLDTAENSNIGLIAREIFAPLYYDHVKPYAEPFIEDMYDMLSPDITNSAVGINLLINADDYTIGALWLNSYSKIPVLKPVDELLEGLEDMLEEDKQQFIQNFLSKNNINNMLEHVRYNKLGAYFETTVDDVGVRGEFAYRDKTPILNEFSSQYSMALGVDYKGFMMYNSLEVKGNYLSKFDNGLYQGIWVTNVDPIDLGFADLKLDHTFYYIVYDDKDYLFSKPSVGLEYNNMEVTLEYYYSSDDIIIDDSIMVLFRMA